MQEKGSLMLCTDFSRKYRSRIRSGSDHRLTFFGKGFVDRANGEPNSMFDKL